MGYQIETMRHGAWERDESAVYVDRATARRQALRCGFRWDNQHTTWRVVDQSGCVVQELELGATSCVIRDRKVVAVVEYVRGDAEGDGWEFRVAVECDACRGYGQVDDRYRDVTCECCGGEGVEVIDELWLEVADLLRLEAWAVVNRSSRELAPITMPILAALGRAKTLPPPAAQEVRAA